MESTTTNVVVPTSIEVVDEVLTSGTESTNVGVSVEEKGEVKAISATSLEKLRDTISKNFHNLIFRRVAEVVTKKDDLIETVITNIIDGRPLAAIYKAGVKVDYTPEEYEKNVEQRYTSFGFFTTETSLRDNDRFYKERIFGASNKYSQLDFFKNMDFRFSYEKADRINYVPPRVGDLVCGLVDKDPQGRGKYGYKFWFTCSEQFLHTWTSIKYSQHEALDKLITSREPTDPEAEIRKGLMKGNKLCTNTYRKWVRANEDCGIPFDNTKAGEVYYHLRTERLSTEYVHVYAALVLMLRYRELPNDSNVPTNLDGGPVTKRWDLPSGWIDTLIKRYGLVEVVERRKPYRRPERKPRVVTPTVNGGSVHEPLTETSPNARVIPGSTPKAIPKRIVKTPATPTPANTPEDAPLQIYEAANISAGDEDDIVIITPTGVSGMKRPVKTNNGKRIVDHDFPPLHPRTNGATPQKGSPVGTESEPLSHSTPTPVKSESPVSIAGPATLPRPLSGSTTSTGMITSTPLATSSMTISWADDDDDDTIMREYEKLTKASQ